MKNILVYTAAIFLLVICILPLACEKDDEETERFTLLTDHSWTYNSIYTICTDPEIIWFVDMLNEEVKGKTIQFSANGEFVSPFERGGWKFSNGETEIITFDSDDPSDIYGHVRIDILTEEVLEITDLADVPPSETCYLKSRLVK